jgi:hypothetical protein
MRKNKRSTRRLRKRGPSLANFREGQVARMTLRDGTSVAGVVERVDEHPEFNWKHAVTVRQGTGRTRELRLTEIAEVETKRGR